MNSKERRKDKRKWKYSVRYSYAARDRYDEMWDWCVTTFGNHSNRVWREKHGHIADYWEFDSELAYLMFIMRFGASDYEQ